MPRSLDEPLMLRTANARATGAITSPGLPSFWLTPMVDSCQAAVSGHVNVQDVDAVKSRPGEVSARPAIALGRVILDASTHCAFLLGSVDERARSVRALNLQLGMLRAEIADIVEGSGMESGQAVRPLRSEVATLIERGRIRWFRASCQQEGRVAEQFQSGHTGDRAALQISRAS